MTVDRFNLSFSFLDATGQLIQACECLLMISKPKSPVSNQITVVMNDQKACLF